MLFNSGHHASKQAHENCFSNLYLCMFLIYMGMQSTGRIYFMVHTLVFYSGNYITKCILSLRTA